MPKREVRYTEIVCDRCGRKILTEEIPQQFHHLLEVKKIAVLWWGKLWTPRGWNTEVYLCDDCLDDLEHWMEGKRKTDEAGETTP